MKRSDLIKEEIALAKENAKKVLANGSATMEEINAATLKIDTLEAKLQLALKEEETIRANVAGIILENQETPTGIDSQAYEKAFLNFIKGKSTVDDQMVIQAALSSGTDEDGGLLIPKDQDN